MGALPRPDVAPGPHRDLVEALHDLHHRAGWPSLRVLARAAACSPTTVSAVFSSPRLPSWGLLELLVEAMDGDVDDFRALWLAATTPDAGPAGPELRIAGRREELAAVRRHLEVAADGLLLVTGEAGMGKTRLVGTAAGLSMPTTCVASGTCLPLSTDVPLLPVADVLRSIHEVDEGQWLKEALADCAPYVPGSLRRLLPELDLLVPTRLEPDDDWSRQRLFASVAAILSALVATRRLAVLVEDLHWADSATLDLLEHLLTRQVGVPILGTWRLEDPATPDANREWCARVQRLPTVRTLALGPLSRQETAEQLAMLATGKVGADQVERIHHRSAGQPLFTEQLAAQADDEQPLPQLLGDLLDRRIEGLGMQARAIARSLGVADRSLTDTLLTDVTGLEATQLAQGLHELDDHRLLRPSTGHDVELRHPLLAEAVRRRLVAPEAVDEHRRIATALAQTPDASPAEIAEHWERAEDPVQEILWRIRAAQAAGQRFALAQEGEQWRRALDLWPDGVEAVGSPGVRKQDAYVAALAALESTDLVAGAAVVQAALADLTDPDDLDAAGIYQWAAHFQGRMGDPEGALGILDRAIRIYEATAPSAAYAHALVGRDLLLVGLDRYDEARAATALATEISAGLGDPVTYRTMLASQMYHDAAAGRVDMALDRVRTASGLDTGGRDPQGEILLANGHTYVLLLIAADADEIAAAARPGLDAAAAWGLDISSVSYLRSRVSEAMRLAGRVSRAVDVIDPVTADVPSPDQWPVHCERVLLDLLRGRCEEATERLNALSRIYLVDLSNQSEKTQDAATVDLWCGRPRAGFERLVASLRDSISMTDPLVNVGGSFVLAARAAADLADSGAITAATRRELLGQLEDLLARAARDPFAVHPSIATRPALAATWAAERARLAGTPSVELWVAAARESDRLTRPHEAAYCRWRAARVALSIGQGSTAHKLLRRAEHDAHEHVPLLAAIRRTEAKVKVQQA